MKITTRDRNGETEREVPDQFFSFREGDQWIAAWRSFDFVAQGSTEEDANRRLRQAISEQCIWDTIDGRAPFVDVPKPPPDVLAEWERRHRETHGSTRDLILSTPEPVEVEACHELRYLSPEHIAKDFAAPRERAAIAAVFKWLGLNGVIGWRDGDSRYSTRANGRDFARSDVIVIDDDVYDRAQKMLVGDSNR